ncbi:NAD(P)H-hydrate dehydratase [Halobacteriales archaeon Cl-PHB]
MITGSEMGVVDANAAALGVPRKQLMESSGNAVATAVRDVADEGDTVTVVAGRGNNGGDAFVAVRFLDELDLRTCLLGRPEAITTDIARENWAALERSDYPTEQWRDATDVDLGSPDVVVDAMLGTGITGSLREPAATAAEAINASDATVVAVDVPSGLDADAGSLADNAVAADRVVTFHDTKPGLAEIDAAVTVADIGLPDAAERFVEGGDLQRIERDPASHKGDNGEVLVVGGGPYAGAPALSAQAALRAGADLVRVTCPASVSHEIQGYSENLIVRRVDGYYLEPSHVGKIMEWAAEHDVLCIGPGLGDDPATLEAVEGLLEAYDGTAVVDADALEVVPRANTTADLICTPHQGELVHMGGRTSDDWEERADLVEDFAAELDATMLVKGAYDVISDGETTRINRTGNAGMTVGGTGDVLAGITAGLAAQVEPHHAAALAAYVNGTAGDRVVEEQGHGLVATDLIGEVSKVIWDSD